METYSCFRFFSFFKRFFEKVFLTATATTRRRPSGRRKENSYLCQVHGQRRDEVHERHQQHFPPVRAGPGTRDADAGRDGKQQQQESRLGKVLEEEARKVNDVRKRRVSRQGQDQQKDRVERVRRDDPADAAADRGPPRDRGELARPEMVDDGRRREETPEEGRGGGEGLCFVFFVVVGTSLLFYHPFS